MFPVLSLLLLLLYLTPGRLTSTSTSLVWTAAGSYCRRPLSQNYPHTNVLIDYRILQQCSRLWYRCTPQQRGRRVLPCHHQKASVSSTSSQFAICFAASNRFFFFLNGPGGVLCCATRVYDIIYMYSRVCTAAVSSGVHVVCTAI